MTRFRLAPTLLMGLPGWVAVLAFGEAAGGAVTKTSYVSLQGADANPGTQEKPLAMIGRAKGKIDIEIRTNTMKIVNAWISQYDPFRIIERLPLFYNLNRRTNWFSKVSFMICSNHINDNLLLV